MFIRKFASIAALSLSAIASFSYAGSAHAFIFKTSTGTTSPTGETNQGAYTPDKNAITVDFNNTVNAKGKKVDGTAPTTGFAQYSFTPVKDKNGNLQKGTSKVQNNTFGPVGSNGDANKSQFLKVDNNSYVTIDLQKLTKSFGLDWGSAQPGNMLQFFNGNTLIKSFTTADIGTFDFYSKDQKGSKGAAGAALLADGKYYQGNSYVQFFAENANEYFNKIVISQDAKYGGSFETDNHSFRTVPEPSLVFGMLAIGGGMLLRKRKNQKALNLG